MSNHSAQPAENAAMKKVTIVVNKKPLHLEDPSIDPARLRDFVGAPDEYEVWHVQNSPDPEGQLPVDDIQITGTIEVRSGDRFRVVPPGTFGCQGEHVVQQRRHRLRGCGA